MSRILVVDDDPDVAEFVTFVLQRDGHEVEMVHSGGAALERFAQTAYDLIVCDLHMPGVDGRGVYEAVVRRGPGPPPAVLFVSGHQNADEYEAFLREERLPVLAKPFTVDALREIAQRLLGGRRSAG